jgi:DNA-binding NarL/FixJ family response regulator
MEKIRVLLVDDHTIFRKGLREIIDKQSDMTVVGEAKDGVEAVNKAKELALDIILMDISMPILDGVKATRLIRDQSEQVGIIILTMYRNDQYVFEAIKAGAQGYILKDADLDEMLEAIRSVYRGEFMIDSSVAGRILSEADQVTPREMEVLDLLALGLTDREIAETLVISESTAHKHVENIRAKLGVRTRTAVVAEARRSGLLKNTKNC